MIAMDWWAAPRGYPENFGRTLYLLGTAGQGPIREPVVVTTPDQAYAVFGDQGTLARAAADAYSMNPTATIVCFRISGSYASSQLWVIDSSGMPDVGMVLRSRRGHISDNDIGYRLAQFTDLETGAPRWALLLVDTDGSTRTYWMDEYPTIGELVRAINRDADLGLSPCYAASPNALLDSTDLIWMNQSTYNQHLLGAESGINLNKDELFEALQASYDLLAGRHIDVIIPLGAYLDDAYLVDYYGSGQYSDAHYNSPEDHLTLWDTLNDIPATYHAQLIEFCKQQNGFGWMTHGVIGMRPLTDPLLHDDPGLYITRLITESALRTRLGISEGEGDGAKDNGYHISVVAGDLLYQAGTQAEHWDSGAIAYGAMICGLGSNLTTTNRPVPTNPPQRVEFDTDTIRELAYMGVVTFRTSVKHGLVVSNGVTAALPDTDMHLLSNARMTQFTLCHMNAVLREFRGQNVDQLMRSGEVERQATALLDNLKLAGVLRDYRFFHTFDRPRRMLVIALKFQTRNSVEEVSASGELTLMG